MNSLSPVYYRHGLEIFLSENIEGTRLVPVYYRLDIFFSEVIG